MKSGCPLWGFLVGLYHLTCHIMCGILWLMANKSHLPVVLKMVGEKQFRAWIDEGLSAEKISQQILQKTKFSFSGTTVARWMQELKAPDAARN